MTEAEIERRIAVATQRQSLRHNLQQTHDRLHDARVSIGLLRALDLPRDVEDELSSLVETIKSEEWRVEQRVREMDHDKP